MKKQMTFSKWFKLARPVLVQYWAELISEIPCEYLDGMTFEEFCYEVWVEV